MPEKFVECLLCGGSITKDVFAVTTLNLAENHGVTRCRNCGFRFLNPRPTKLEYQEAYATGRGAIAELYPIQEEFYAQEDSLRISGYRKKLDILTKVGAGKRLLEIGSCTGVFLNEARNRGFEVEGIELSEGNCQIAKTSFGLDLRCIDVEEQDFSPESFDVVFSSHVFEHLMDPLAVAKLLTDLLRPGGFLMMEVPNQYDTFSMMRKRWMRKVLPRQRSFLSIHHTVFFSPRTLCLLGQLSGCRVRHVRNVYSGHNNPLLHPKIAISRGIALIIGGSSHIELLAQKV